MFRVSGSSPKTSGAGVIGAGTAAHSKNFHENLGHLPYNRNYGGIGYMTPILGFFSKNLIPEEAHVPNPTKCSLHSKSLLSIGKSPPEDL